MEISRRTLAFLLLGLISWPYLTASAHAKGEYAITVPSVSKAVCHSSVTSYRQALSTIVCIFARDLELPVYGGSLILHPSRQSFESSLVSGVWFDPTYARQTAGWALAVTMPDRILVNEPALSSLPWLQRIMVLAHELTHSVQYGLASGRRSTSDQWLREGLAEWVSARVADSLEPGSFTRRFKLATSRIRKTTAQSTAALSQLVTVRQFAELRNTTTTPCLYDVAFLAADALIGEFGLPAVLEYFRLFSRSDDRPQNFRTAFGRDSSVFEEWFSLYLETLLE